MSYLVSIFNRNGVEFVLDVQGLFKDGVVDVSVLDAGDFFELWEGDLVDFLLFSWWVGSRSGGEIKKAGGSPNFLLLHDYRDAP